jgi:hypothetical protein
MVYLIQKTLFAIFFLILVVCVIQKYYANGYIGINRAPCAYCLLFNGFHYHYLSPTHYTKNYNEHSAQGKMCDICKKYPGQMHIHKNDQFTRWW